MKFNWGTRIAIFYTVFVAGIMYLVVRSSQQNIDLVTEDYYAQELNYQQRIDDIKRTALLSAQPEINLHQDVLTIKLPHEFQGKNCKGIALLYCPSNAGNDMSRSFTTSDGIIRIPLPEKNNGLHEVQLSWNTNALSYYSENKLFIP